MIDILKKIEKEEILGLLSNPDNFKSLDVDYYPPRVERIWTQLGEYRLAFHYLHPCDKDQALYHPHPWPSAIHQLDGEYETGITFSDDQMLHTNNNTGQANETLRSIEAAKFIFKGDVYCQMLHRNGFHYVRPITLCRSTMLMGAQFDNIVKNPATKQLNSLSYDRTNEIRLWFYDKYAQLLLNP